MVADSSGGKVRSINIENEMRDSYLDYAMSVITSRALPDVRDGLKPVQRRILFSMHELGLRSNTSYRKSAKITGEVMGKYHPHGDAPIYDTLVRMAQEWSLRYPLVDGQGNFGSVDGDPPAAQRYTEARLASIADEMLADIEKDTVDFYDNYDGSEQQPVVLPTRLPNLLVNGSAGIAVGMATNVPPHNLTEICDAIVRMIDKPETTTEELFRIVKGPDFPTAGIIIGREGIKQAFATGQGKVITRARTEVEEMPRGGRYQIVVTELPYQVNKAELIKKIAEMVKDKRIDGISDLRDESDRTGMRMVIELTRGGQPKQVLNSLYKHTSMQTSFGVHMLCLVNGQPKTVNLPTALKQFIAFRRDVIRRRTEFDLAKAKDREHILSGLLRAIDKLDAIIRLIRNAASASAAKEQLMTRPFNFSDRQAQAILDMQLRRLAALERKQLQDEHDALVKRIAELEAILADPAKVDALIKEETAELKKKHGDARRTQIIDQELENFSDEDLIPHEGAVVTLSNRGYIKRVPLETYRKQKRGGRGITGMVTREEDAVRRLIVADTHSNLLFFTDRGRVFPLKVFEVPDASRTAKGIPLINVVDIAQGEQVTAIVATESFEKECLILATKMGEVKRTVLSEFAQIRRNGLIAMGMEDGDELVAARMARATDDILIASANGQTIRFGVKELRMASRTSGGVRGIRLEKSDYVVGMELVEPKCQLLTLSANGYGKRTALDQYPKKGRGTGGVIGFKVTNKTGPVAAVRVVDETRDLMLISQEGIVLRTSVESIRQTGRSAEGVSVMKLAPSDRVASIAVIEEQVTPPAGDTDDKPKRGARNGGSADNAENGATNGTVARGKSLGMGQPGENGHKPGTNGAKGE
ncbi:MAG: DNA gyrase subunit A [Chloroflexi bacterium]|nr:DNA gyrase subunit A [Chloroflexota bacterium]